MSEHSVPKMDSRTRTDYLKDYREFDIEVGDCFYASFKHSVASVLHDHGIMSPGAAYYCEEMRIIDDLKFFPGSPMFFAKLLEWAFETKRAYKDAYHNTMDCSDYEAALYVCVCEFDNFVKLVMQQA